MKVVVWVISLGHKSKKVVESDAFQVIGLLLVNYLKQWQLPQNKFKLDEIESRYNLRLKASHKKQI